MHLGQLKGYRAICVTPNDSITIRVLVLLKGKVLAPCQPWICKQLPEDLACRSLEQSEILSPVTLLPQVNNLNVTFLYSTHQPLMHVVINLCRIKVWVVQHLLDEILNNCSIQVFLFCKILQKTLAGSEKAGGFPVQLWQKPQLQANNMLYNMLYNM